MEGLKRLRIPLGLASAGLLVALIVALAGRAPSAAGDVAGVAAEVDALIREATAAVQARADTLAQLPRLGWAVATDEATVRDMTTEELAFRTAPGEHIEIANMPKGGAAEARQLLRLPPDPSFAMPMLPGSHLFVDGGTVHVVAVVTVEPRQRADELTGLLAVSRLLDTTPIEQRLDARRVHAELHIGQASITLGAPAPAKGGAAAKAPLTSQAARGAELSVVGPGAGPVWTKVLAALIALLSLGGGALLWRRKLHAETGNEGARAAAPVRYTDADTGPAPVPEAPAPDVPAPEVRAPEAPASTAAPASEITAVEIPNDDDEERTNEWSDDGVKTDPVVAQVPEAARDAVPVHIPPPWGSEPRPRTITGAVSLKLDPMRSGRVDITPRSGSVAFPPEGHGGGKRASTPMLGNESDPRNEEYKALFTEYLRLRQTTGEPVESLDVVDFVEALREKRAQLIRELGVKEVRFRLAFDNGKAAIRYTTTLAAQKAP